MNPFSPQVFPHEFLMVHELSLIPTRVTPWLREVLQLLKTPEEYFDQLVASTATETGLLATARAKSLQLLISVNPLTLKDPELILQVPCLPVYGYSS